MTDEPLFVAHNMTEVVTKDDPPEYQLETVRHPWRNHLGPAFGV